MGRLGRRIGSILKDKGAFQLERELFKCGEENKTRDATRTKGTKTASRMLYI